KGWDLVCHYATESNNAKYKEWAQINRYRADLALLTEIALSVDYKNIRMLNETQIKSMQSRLKKNKRVLLKQSIPLSRKILIILFTTSYNLFAKVINTMIRIKHYGA
ncbi:glycosyltransferase family 2 protein, partial [Streptococcus mitis]|nr:glycosyltransferase family 2 protein [Streptococcus mitis]